MRIELDKPLTLSYIKGIFCIPYNAEDGNIVISAITTDSRLVKKGDLFIAIDGENISGEDFVESAGSKGAYIISRKWEKADIKVKDTRDALLLIAEKYKEKFHLKETVVITGSVGKTTTKNITSALLSTKFKTHSTKGNLNNELGVPYTVLSMKEDTEILVIEAGMNHKGELKRLSRCIKPTLAVITNIGTAHIGNLGSREEIAKAKLEILGDDLSCFALVPYGEELLDNIINKATVSCSSEFDEFFLKTVKYSGESLEFEYYSQELSIPKSEIASAGLHIKECLAFALAVCITSGMSEKDMIHAIKAISSIFHSKREQIGNLTVIDDSYNASYESVKLALATLCMHKDRAVSLLIGDMLELGSMAERLHFSVGMLAAKSNLKHLYAFGRYAPDVKKGAVAYGMKSEDIFVNTDLDSPDKTALEIFKRSENELILFKASNKVGLYRIKDILKTFYQ